MIRIDRNPVSTQVFEILRQRIVTLRIPPGAKIQIGALSEELSISAIPIREALKQLAERGLVCANPGMSYHAVKLSNEDVRDIFELRKVLENFAVEKAIKQFSETELKGLHEQNCKLLNGKLSPEELRVRFDQTDVKLHQGLIIGNSGNKFAKLFYSRMNDLVSIVRHLNERIDLAIREHLEIIDALIKRDLAEAKNRLTNHLDNSAEGCLPIPQSGLEWSRKTASRSGQQDLLTNHTGEARRTL